MKLPDWLWPTYRPEEHVIVPPVATKKKPSQTTEYDYRNITISPNLGLMVNHEEVVGEDGTSVLESQVIAPNTDNGQREVKLTTADLERIRERNLIEDKAAYLKPYFAAGATKEEAASMIRRRHNAPRGYSPSTIKPYFAAFKEALPHQDVEKPATHGAK